LPLADREEHLNEAIHRRRDNHAFAKFCMVNADTGLKLIDFDFHDMRG
jgi:hypothetical protein